MIVGGRSAVHPCFFRNAATETVKQELLFVGQESGKLIAIRDIIAKVKFCNLSQILSY